MLFSQVDQRRVVNQRLNDTIWTTGLQTLFSSQTIGNKVTTQLRSAVSTGKPGTIVSFGITMSREKLVVADDESKAILKNNRREKNNTTDRQRDNDWFFGSTNRPGINSAF